MALVTGAARGIGFEVCRLLARDGMTVLLGARDADKARAAAAERNTNPLAYSAKKDP